MNIYIEGYYGVKNLGDDYILMSILGSLSKISSSIHDISVASKGDDYQNIFSLYPQLTCQVVYAKKGKINHLLDDDVYIFGGGGLFPSDNWKSYLKLLVKFASRKIRRKKNLIYGIDLCKLSGFQSKIIWKAIELCSDLITVRNDFSASLLEKIGVERVVYSYTDLTFGLETNAERVFKNSLCKYNSAVKKLRLEDTPYVVVVLAKPWSDNEIREKHYQLRFEKLCNQISTLINGCIRDHYIPVFLPFFHNNDRDFINRIEPLLCGDYRICEENCLNIEEKRLLFASAKACISMRFHGIAFSLYCGTPCEAISYAPKALELMKDVNLENYCVEFGIRSDSCFFKEFDIDQVKLNEIYTRLFSSDTKIQFKAASKTLKEIAQKGETKMLKVVVTGREK